MHRLGPGDLRLPAGVAAAVVLGASVGDGFVAVVAVLLAAGPVAGAAAALAMAGAVARWGTADLGAIAGDQAVLGAAVAAGPVAAMLGSGLAAAGLVLAARRPMPSAASPVAWWDRASAWVPAVALGLGAGTLVGGPSLVGGPELLVRAAGAAGGLAAAVTIAVVVSRRPTLDRPFAIGGLLATGVGLVLAVAA